MTEITKLYLLRFGAAARNEVRVAARQPLEEVAQRLETSRSPRSLSLRKRPSFAKSLPLVMMSPVA